MSEQMVSNGDKFDFPVNKVRMSDSFKQFVIDECVICGETHYHGSKDQTVAEGGKSHRSSHCSNPDGPGGYYLELADDADPPPAWYDYISAGDEQ